ncbi:hypothetical protein [Sporolactobacillus laevolacticus]|uniref:Uncharacterized protein n=1 Tax=Sporolactobacillus laevolacticus DSM 442 TaxID=1395513 RepID=V6IVW1_9BACL|nr:hypothetical protein [Sporolactobacillus laevolacticus]EST11285.1 hypothetical protein P343_12860 [Sporolactobacillus laevolacticus DSM 442]
MPDMFSNGTPEVNEFRKKIASFGKQIASEHGDKDFPDWLNFKVGICTIEGIPYDLNRDYYLGRFCPKSGSVGGYE